MRTNHAIVIDNYGNKITFVLVVNNEPQYYMLSKDEKLIYDDIGTALSMLKPRWNGSRWIETATPAEIEAEKPEPVPYIPSMDERLQAAEQALLTIMMGEI